MDETLPEIVENWFKRRIPLLLSLFLLLMTYVPLHLPMLPFFKPDVGLICVFFWGLFRQDLFNVFSVFFLGLVADGMGAAPLGLNIAAYLFVFVLCSTFGRYINMKPFIINWVGFSLISAVTVLLQWLVCSIYYRHFLSMGGIPVGYASTVLLYPVFARLNMAVQNRFLADEGAVYEQG